MSFTIAIPTRGAKTDIQRILDTFAGIATHYPLLIIANTRESKELSRMVDLENTKLIFVDGGGVARARNIALSVVNSKIVVFVDDDVLPDIHEFEKLVGSLDDHNVAVATARIISVCKDEQLLNVYKDFFSLDRGSDARTFTTNESISPMSVWATGVGAVFAVNCDKLLGAGEIPVFDEALSNGRFCGGAEDVDFFLQCHEADLILHYCASATFLHQESPDLHKLRNKMMRYARADGAFYAKWHHSINTGDILSDLLHWISNAYKQIKRRFEGKHALPILPVLYEPLGKFIGAVWWLLTSK